MKYVSNRNHGCRMKEVTISDCKALLLENDRMHILILLGKGADIVEFVHKKTDTDFMWRSPGGLDLLSQPPGTENRYVGGWFECFPNAGSQCVFQGIGIPQYGDVKDLPWEYAVLTDSPEIISVRLFVRSNALPLVLEKVLTLERGGLSLMMEESVWNLSNMPVHYTWGHHPNIGEPFLNENCVIDLPGGELVRFETDASGELVERAIGHWPHITENNAKRDLSCVPAPRENRHDLLYIKNIPGNRVAVRDTKTGLGFEICWDEKVFRHMLLWCAFDAEKWLRTFGHRYILCFLLKSSHFSSVSDAVLHGEQLTLMPGENFATWVRASVLEDHTS